MGYPLVFEFYGSTQDTRSSLLAIVDRVSQMRIATGTWFNLYVWRHATPASLRLSDYSEAISLDELKKRVSQNSSGAHETWCAATSFQLSISDEDKSISHEELFSLKVSTRESPPHQLTDSNNRLIAALDIESHHLFRSNDERIQEFWTDLLLDLTSAAISAISPSSMHAYVPDFGFPWPINSLMSYFESDSECARDTLRNVQYWKYLAEVSTSNPERLREHIGGFRHRPQLDALLHKLRSIPLNNFTIEAEHVKAVRESCKFDIVARPESGTDGFTVLNYPDFFTHVVDDFYFKIIEEALLA